MRSTGRLVLALAVILVAAVTFPACENPFDPIDKTDEIRGLSFIDFSLTWDKWDSDPESDGVIVTIDYSNEFGDGLNFHDKPHQVVIEFYEQLLVGAEIDDNGNPVPNTGRPTFGRLIFSFPIEHDHSDDDIRIPIEAYEGRLRDAGFADDESAVAFVVVRVFPPKAVPQEELVAFLADQEIFVPEPTAAAEGELP